MEQGPYTLQKVICLPKVYLLNVSNILNTFRVIYVDGTWPNNWTPSQVNKLTLPITMGNHVVSQ